jgi:hypothetical protein
MSFGKSASEKYSWALKSHCCDLSYENVIYSTLLALLLKLCNVALIGLFIVLRIYS